MRKSDDFIVDLTEKVLQGKARKGKKHVQDFKVTKQISMVGSFASLLISLLVTVSLSCRVDSLQYVIGVA